ncbi:MAG: hypothetical protein J6M91_03725 [Methanobrevibacter sp.]|nr:hypothetical protein [Methanobrevibacter sp.]
MIPTYEYKSKIANIIAFLAGLITYMGRDMLAQILPKEIAYLAPFIVTFAGYILAQKTENIRVDVAQQRAVERYQQNNFTPATDSYAPATNNPDIMAGDENGN